MSRHPHILAALLFEHLLILPRHRHTRNWLSFQIIPLLVGGLVSYPVQVCHSRLHLMLLGFWCLLSSMSFAPQQQVLTGVGQGAVQVCATSRLVRMQFQLQARRLCLVYLQAAIGSSRHISDSTASYDNWYSL